MNFPSLVMLLIGLFGLVMLILGLLSLGQAGNIPLLGIKVGGWFLVIVSLIIAACGFVGFSRMRRRR